MATNAIVSVMNNTPADAVARRVTDQSGCGDDWLATVRNLKEINDLLVARRLELKIQIGVNERNYQWKIRDRYKKLKRSGADVPAVMTEYITLGQQIHRLNKEYARVMRENNAEPSPGAIRRKEKHLHIPA